MESKSKGLNEVKWQEPIPERAETAGTADECILYYKTDYVEINFFEPEGILSTCWLRPVASHEYRDGIQRTGQILLEHSLVNLVVNNQRMGVLTIADQGWLAKISVEVISKSKLKHLAIVSSTDILQQITNEALDKKVKDETPYFATEYFLSEHDALEWLRAL